MQLNAGAGSTSRYPDCLKHPAMSFVNTMRPKPSTSWFTKKSSRVSPSPSPSIIFPHDQQNPNNGQTAIDPSSSNPSSQKNDTNETLSMLLRETHAALAQRSDRTNNNQTLCTKLASAIVKLLKRMNQNKRVVDRMATNDPPLSHP